MPAKKTPAAGSGAAAKPAKVAEAKPAAKDKDKPTAAAAPKKPKK